MAALPLALLLLATPPISPDARIAASAAAAQALQGPLDGTWTLMCTGCLRPHMLYILQIVDPVGGAAGLQAAWRGSAGERAGLVDYARRSAGRLSLRFTDQGVPVRVVVRRRGADWSGELRRGDEIFPVSLRRR